MSEELQRIVPSGSSQSQENIAASETTYQFYREVEVRSEFKLYCEWYHCTAKNNREQMEKMRGELNIFQWFRRKN
ncbi:MAG: hypothetical protein HC836_08525 [Richelia sp. RM2_1_2]|nr:hypothetical protein [Richelia sp. SM1_7_0]NJN06565.1 hypothetical protein [Richelia sp. RM1_1_1]NJO58387.1 hypothetical protein [Richelia sp. RM2_1_2]